jgi:glycosyltransferase involved in cell wall biosynthesis
LKGEICVIIRVYNRMSDLEECINAIRKYWKENNYYVVVVSNGKNKGNIVSESVREKADKVVELEENAGHLKGNSQLLMEGIKYIPKECKYSVILEADTWIFTDSIINKYIKKMEKEKAVWASAEWIERKWTLGLDIAIIETEFLNKNKKIFDFSIHPEGYVCNYIKDKNEKFIYIKENMPVHIPKAMRWIYNADKGRIRLFPKAKMVTHHIEELKGEIEEKKYLANVCCDENIFKEVEWKKKSKEYIKMKIYIFLAEIFPKSSWIKRKKREKI